MAQDEDLSGEDRLIGRYFRPLARDPRALSLIDDVALMAPPPGCDIVLTTDAIVGGVHFLADDPADLVARKGLRVNLSDIAAKGAAPSGYLLTLALPDDTAGRWLAEFSRGLAEDAEAYGCALLGGDTVRTPGQLLVSITMIGVLPAGSMVGRTGARPGDRVFVSGTIGDAALGLRIRKDADLADAWGLDGALRAHLVGRYLLPQPRTALAEVVRRFASASMDVSDGLVGDLAKLCRASGVGATVENGRIPYSAGARAALAADPGLIEPLLTGGDDYEIVCTVPGDRAADFRRAAAAVQTEVTEIGEVTEGARKPIFIDARGRPMAFVQTSFSHF